MYISKSCASFEMLFFYRLVHFLFKYAQYWSSSSFKTVTYYLYDLFVLFDIGIVRFFLDPSLTDGLFDKMLLLSIWQQSNNIPSFIESEKVITGECSFGKFNWFHDMKFENLSEISKKLSELFRIISRSDIRTSVITSFPDDTKRRKYTFGDF